MKTLLACILFAATAAHAIMIEDSAVRLEFELFWGPPQPFGGSVNLNLGPEYQYPGFPSFFDGSSGSGLWLITPGGNQYVYNLNIRRAFDGVVQGVLFTTVIFRTTGDSAHAFLVGDPIFSSVHFGGFDGVFPIPDNPYAARVVLGQLHGVPDTGSTMLLLFSALAGLAMFRPAHSAAKTQTNSSSSLC